MTKAQQTGMAGTYLVASELSKRGLNAVVTSRNMRGTDILVEDPDTGVSASVQVKSNRTTFAFFLIGDPSKIPTNRGRFFALVNMRKDRDEIFIVPAAAVAKVAKTKTRSTGSTFHWVDLPDVEAYRDGWERIEAFLRGPP